MNANISETSNLKLEHEPATYKAMRDSFVRETTRFLHIQDDAMTGQAAAINGWMERRHEGILSSVETLQQLNQCSKPEEGFQLQRKLAAGYCDRWTRDVTAVVAGFFAASQRGVFAMQTMATGSLPLFIVAPSEASEGALRKTSKATIG